MISLWLVYDKSLISIRRNRRRRITQINNKTKENGIMRRRKKRNNNNKAKKTHNHDKIIIWIGTRMYVCMYWKVLSLYSPHSCCWVLSCFLTFICWRQREDNTNHAGRCFSLGEERHWSPTFIEKQTHRNLRQCYKNWYYNMKGLSNYKNIIKI